MRKGTRNLLLTAGVGGLALYFMGKSGAAAPASSAGTARYVGDYDSDPNYSGYNPGSIMQVSPPGYGIGTSSDGGGNIMQVTPPWISPPATGGGSGTAPWWRRRYGKHIKDANSSYYGSPGSGSIPWGMNNIEYGNPWGSSSSNQIDGGYYDPNAAFGPSAVELEQSGSIATMASDIDAGAY